MTNQKQVEKYIKMFDKVSNRNLKELLKQIGENPRRKDDKSKVKAIKTLLL